MRVSPVIFRADASTRIGTGHVMRCLTLADALSRMGWGCGFVCREQEGHMAGWIQARGHEIWLLPAAEAGAKPLDSEGQSPHATWLGVPWQQDALDTSAIIGSAPPRWLVVDHYGVDAAWERAIADSADNIMVIDDLADRDHHCRLLLDQNLGRTPQDYRSRVSEQCDCLTGLEYALLRDEFRYWRDHRSAAGRDGVIGRILVTMGGADPDNITARVLSALSQCRLDTDTVIDVVLGPSAPHLESVRALVSLLSGQIEVTVGAQNMAERMALADLAIGAAGATQWERCCLGLPTLVVAIADNQHTFLGAMEQHGLAAMASLETLETDVEEFIASMQSDPGRFREMAMMASEAVDGFGAQRVADRMVSILEAVS